MKTMVCKKCGSEAVVKTAWVEWNTLKQEWEIDEIFGDDDWCKNCEALTTIEEKEDILEIPVSVQPKQA